MSKKFVTNKEHALIHSINKELIQNFIGQEIFYYGIILEETNVHDLYGEAIQKTWAAPVRLNGLIKYDSPGASSTEQGIDTKYTLEAYLHTKELEERNLNPREGDFIEFGQVYFEITSVTLPQMVFGQHNNRIMTKLICTVAREGQFAAGDASDEFVDNSHPDQVKRSRRLEGS